MTNADAVRLALVALLAIVPFAFVVFVALVRGYTIHLSMWRPGARRRDGDDDGA